MNLNHCVIFSQSNFTLNLKSNGLSTVIDIYSINQQMRKGLGKHENDPESTKCRQCMRPALQKHGLLNPNLFIKHSKNSCFSQVKIFSGSSFQACFLSTGCHFFESKMPDFPNLLICHQKSETLHDIIKLYYAQILSLRLVPIITCLHISVQRNMLLKQRREVVHKHLTTYSN